jgi:P4 family phage/plasmid primase-like protien
LTSPNEENQQSNFNDWADHWRYVVGANIIPAITEIKNFYKDIPYKQWFNRAIPKEQHEKWKAEGKFKKGMAVLAGRLWHRPDRKDEYLNLIDCDNQKAIDEIICSNSSGEGTTLQEVAQVTIIEQHATAPNKAHMYVRSHRPFAKKSSDKNGSLADKVEANEVPAVEVKGQEGVHFIAPSLHIDGTQYQILGVKEPALIEDFDLHIDRVLAKYGIPYLSQVDSETNKSQIPIEEIFQDDFVVLKNHNRHEALMRIMESLIKRNMQILGLNEIKEFARKWNDKHCKPPLDNKQFEKQWKSATEFIVISSASASASTNSNPYNNNGEDETQKDSQQHEHFLDLADELIKKFHLKTVKIIKDIYYFDLRRYVNNGNIVVEKELEARYLKALEAYQDMIAGMTPEEIEKSELEPPMPWTRKRIDELLGQIERRTYVDISGFNSDVEWLACETCMLNLRTGHTAPFSPDFLNTTLIPVKYSDAYAIGPVSEFFRLVERQYLSVFSSYPCPKIMKFLYDVVQPDDVELLLDFMAYCLWRDYKYAIWQLWDGWGQNGKSILLNLFEAFLGKDNTSAESLERLLNERFAPAGLYQKLANIDADVSADMLFKNTGRLKKLTGNDEFPAEFKNKTPFKYRNYAKLFFSCNEIPETTDTTDALFRRLIIVNFTQQFLGNKDDPNIFEKLRTSEEFSGLLFELMGRLPRIVKQGIRPTTNKTMEETYEKYVRGSNPIQYFIEKALNIIGASGKKVPKNEMYDSYLCFCHAKKIAPESEWSFSRKLTKEFGFQYKQFRKDGVPTWCWTDVTIQDWKAIEDADQRSIAEFTEEQWEELR